MLNVFSGVLSQFAGLGAAQEEDDVDTLMLSLSEERSIARSASSASLMSTGSSMNEEPVNELLIDVEAFAGKMTDDFTNRKKMPSTNEHLVWTEARTAHAQHILKLSPSLSKARYHLCPTRISDDHFWASYFTMLRPHLAAVLYLDVDDLDVASASDSLSDTLWNCHTLQHWTCLTCHYDCNGAEDAFCQTCAGVRS
eukprot:TRINITY_DN1224_c2_g1_i1.p1 TRINITY_DN1224_c2_g1~~TRINITY_DN1224_c2_g1_i1.p1  ORF type:complete len:210 (+),score=31.25 TRINITY_DN1224_c2_g1_i1:42-632(+)